MSITPIEVEEEVLQDLGLTDEQMQEANLLKGTGCKRCNDTGYKGRIALYEVMDVNDDIKEYVLQGYSAMELKREAIKLGMQTLRQSALNKLVDGMITASEVLRITRADQ